jgi:hypothetical protein
MTSDIFKHKADEKEDMRIEMAVISLGEMVGNRSLRYSGNARRLRIILRAFTGSP